MSDANLSLCLADSTFGTLMDAFGGNEDYYECCILRRMYLLQGHHSLWAAHSITPVVSLC